MDFVASAVMNKTVSTVPADMTLDELESRFLDEQVNGFPVVEQGQVVGLVSKTDFVKAHHPSFDVRSSATPRPALGNPETQITVRDIMSRNIVSVNSNARLHEVADLMYEKRLHRILVIDAESLVGIITPFDFVRLYSNDQIGTDGRPTNTLDF